MRAPLSLLLLATLSACTGPVREPQEVHRGRALNTPSPDAAAGAEEDADALAPGTVGLLERLFGEPVEPADSAPSAEPDPRPVCLDLGFEAGVGPFRGGGHELPRAAAEGAFSEGLLESFAADGALAGPLPIGWGDLFYEGDEGLPAVIEPPIPPRVLERARALGGQYLLVGRLERFEHERVVVYVPGRSTYENRERGRIRLWYSLYELEYGSLLCSELLDRRYSFDDLSAAALASVERVLARLAADELRAALATCVGSEESRSGDAPGSRPGESSPGSNPDD